MLERIRKIIDNEGISVRAFEQRINASNGLIRKAIANNTDIYSKWIGSIVENFPQYSAEWLLTGKGQMLKSRNSDINDLAGGNINERDEHYGAYNNNNGNNDKIVDILRDQLDKKDTVITKLIDQQNDLIAQIRELNKKQK